MKFGANLWYRNIAKSRMFFNCEAKNKMTVNADTLQNKTPDISDLKCIHISRIIAENTADKTICKSSRFNVNFGLWTISFDFIAL